MIALLLAALCAPGQAALPGRVVLAGQGARLDAAASTEFSARDRIVLDASASGDAPDPMEPAGPPAGRMAVSAGAETREIAEAVLGAPCVVLAGGGALDWYQRLFPRGHPSRLAAALREAHAGGATIVGAGASAPYLASWAMVPWSDLGKPRRNPRRVRDDVAVRGLGLVEGFLVDSSACLGGDPARALRAAFDGFLETVIYLDGAAVVVADPKERSARFLGAGSVLVFDFRTARRGRGTWSGGRLSILGAGDGWSARHGAECAGERDATDAVANPRVDAVRASLERASARFEPFADERTTARKPAAFVDLAFDLAWDRNGS